MHNRRTAIAASLLTAGAAMLGDGVLHPARAQTTRRPNILFMLVDNLGYGELGAYGGGQTRGATTPRIDSLARDGLRLTNMNMEASARPADRAS